MKYSSKAAVVVALATAVALCSMATFLPSAQASPIGQPNSQQSAFSPLSSDKQAPLCGTVVAIDFGQEEFSVGYINPTTHRLDLIPNKDYNETTTPSYVRVVNFLDGSQEITLGNDALYRPFDEREKAVIAARREEFDQWYKDHPVWNYTLPNPQDKHEFRPNEAYGLGVPESTGAGKPGKEDEALARLFGSSRLRRKIMQYEMEMGGGGFRFGVTAGEEWDDGLPKPNSVSFGDHNETMGQCIRTPEELDRIAERKRKVYERRQKVAGLLMERAKEMAEARLEAKVKYAVVTTPSFTTTNRYPQPESTIDAATRGGLDAVRVLDQSEAAVLAYEPVLAEAERAAKGRPQTVVMYYLNDETEGISVFETYRARGEEEFLRLKSKAKYHFFQAVDDRMRRVLGKHLYEKYKRGLYFTADKPIWEDPLNPDKQLPTHPLDEMQALSNLSAFVGRGWVEKWAADSGDKEEKYYLSDWDYVLFSRREWWDFEKAFLKKHFLRMLERAYERSGVAVEERKGEGEVDFFLVVDESRFRNSTSAIMKEALGGDGKVRELVDAVVEPKFAIAHGAARLAEHLSKVYSREPCL